MPERYDVFLSYAHADAAQVHRLAENLHNAGLDVFLDEWEIAAGDVLVHQLDRGILNSRNGILAVTPAALSRPWVQEEYARGDYDQALDWYKRSLQIEEELGNRAGMASSYGQLGRVAEDRNDYDQALDWYKRALQILEELGNRAGMASSISQLGVLATEQGRPEEALPLNLRSLAIRLELRVPEVRIDLHWLNRQRELLGEERFTELLRQYAGEEGAQAILGVLSPPPSGEAEPAGPAQTPDQ